LDRDPTVRALLFRRSRPGRRAATAVLLMLVTCASLSPSSFASEVAPPPGEATLAKAGSAIAPLYAIFRGNQPLALTPPSLLVDPGPAAGPNKLHHLQWAPPNTSPRNLRAAEPAGPVLLSLDLSLRYLQLAVHGDYRAGLLPFLGTSTTSLAGLRLRF
jgi:hypothetical protein